MNYREGSVIADVEIQADGQKPVDKTTQSIEQAVKPAFSAAQVQGLRIDPSSVEVIAKPGEYCNTHIVHLYTVHKIVVLLSM